MDNKIFRYSGVGSKAWYINRIKIGFPAGKTGFTYLRADSAEDGKQLSFDEIKSSMSQLVAAGYVKKHGKPDAPRSDKYEVTSFGHRYLEEHKAELEQPKESESHGAVKPGVEHHVPQIPPFKPSLPSVIVPPAPERPIDRVAKAGITLGQEIEKHKAAETRPVSPSPRINKEQGSDEPRINKNPESGLKNETVSENSPHDLAADVKEKLKDLLLEKFLDKTLDQVLSFKSISIHDFLAYVEKSE